MDEILYINGNSAAFKTGILRFPKEIEKEMYEDYLRIPNWEDLLTIQDIEKIILHPTIEGLTKIINIKDTGMFDRVRGVFVRLKNTNDDDISLRVEKIIQARLDELRRGVRNTEIIIKAKDTVAPIATEEVDELKEQNKLLQEQMANMQKMMEQMMSMQTNTTPSAEKEKTDKEEEKVAKKPGRPKKTQ